MFTLENKKCDCIRKEKEKWGFYRNLPRAEFGTIEDAQTAIKEMENQGLLTDDIEIVSW